jgi:DNA-binding FadR family transcriptional regulator
VREVDIPRAAGTHAAILRAVAALDEEAAALASQRMMAFLLEFTEGSQRNAAARRRPKSASKVPGSPTKAYRT